MGLAFGGPKGLASMSPAAQALGIGQKKKPSANPGNMGGTGPQPAAKGMGSFMTGGLNPLAPNRMRNFL